MSQGSNPSHENDREDVKNEKPKEKAAGSEQINLKVVTQDSTEVFFKIKKNTPLKKLMEAFCNKQGLNLSAVRFLSDGVRITPDKTAADLGLQDGDVIDAMMNQVGGF